MTQHNYTVKQAEDDRQYCSPASVRWYSCSMLLPYGTVVL